MPRRGDYATDDLLRAELLVLAEDLQSEPLMRTVAMVRDTVMVQRLRTLHVVAPIPHDEEAVSVLIVTTRRCIATGITTRADARIVLKHIGEVRKESPALARVLRYKMHDILDDGDAYTSPLARQVLAVLERRHQPRDEPAAVHA